MGGMHPDLVELVNRRLRELGSPGRPLSYRAASQRASDRGCSVSPETVRKIALNRHSGRLDDDTVLGLAAALGVDRPTILRAMHEQRSAPMVPWEPPRAAERLSFNQRRALDQLILSMVDATTNDQEKSNLLLLSRRDNDTFGADSVTEGYSQATFPTSSGTAQTVAVEGSPVTKEQVEANNELLRQVLEALQSVQGRTVK